MIRIVVIAVCLAACAAPRDAEPREHVPATYHDVQASAGHVAHVGKVACAQCHGEDGFAPPPPEVCASCHAKTTPLHHDVLSVVVWLSRCLVCFVFGSVV